MGEPAPLRWLNVQYFGAIEAQKRLAAHLHVALRLRVSDDGVGGGQPDEGTGLTGLRDRVEALGGSIDVTSPAGRGTVLNVSLPIEPTSGATGASEVS